MKKELNKEEARALMNNYGNEKKPFLFIIDYEMKKNLIYPLDKVPHFIKYNFNGINNDQNQSSVADLNWSKNPVSYKEFDEAFKKAKKELKYGNSFLLNLTFPTALNGIDDLDKIYDQVAAKYKLLIEDECVVFSPEIFVKIIDGKISSYPMKGTIDSDLPNALDIIMMDEKETAEHYTIVDLIRNDLSMVAKSVELEKFRYADLVKTNEKQLYQISSEITGKLEKNYHQRIGSIIIDLLPAGSISGAPKVKTVEIIKKIEIKDRGYYTGIMGIYDGKNLDSGVMIRYVEKTKEGVFYRSGCGITHKSDSRSEYQELLDKVYLPLKENYVS